MKINLNKPLSERQYSFALNYVRNGFDVFKAAKDAGYSDSFAKVNSYQLIRNPQVQEHINKAVDKIERKFEKELMVTLEDRVKILSRIIYDIVPIDGSQPKTTLYREAIKAVNELNKMFGSLAPSKQININLDETKNRLLEARRQYKEY